MNPCLFLSQPFVHSRFARLRARILKRRPACISACFAFGSVACAGAVAAQGGPAFTHPGLLHTQASIDLAKARVQAKSEPWLSGWKRLTDNALSDSSYQPKPVDTLYRGTGTPENYGNLYRDVAAAYANALRWHLTGQEGHARAAVRILDAWADRLKKIDGTSDKYLAAGIYGYQYANAVELMRGYAPWQGFAKNRDLLRTVFYPMNHDFIVRHNNSCISHYWANWDLVNLTSIIAIGILSDDRTLFDEAVTYFKSGAGNGALPNLVWYLHPGGLGQWQESGRDQGHSLLGPAIAGALCEMAWNQGEDLYGLDDNRLLKGFEYVAKYNLGDSVPYATYDNCDKVNQTVISPDSRGGIRPGWELIFNHYAHRKGLAAPYSQAYAEKVRPEGGGGNYGPNSGGFDQLGYGTLMHTLPEGSLSLRPALPRDRDRPSPAWRGLPGSPGQSAAAVNTLGRRVQKPARLSRPSEISPASLKHR